MAQRVVDQAVAEGHHAVREVVLRQPGHHALLLHVGAAGHVHDQVAQILPVPAGRKAPVSAATAAATAAAARGLLPHHVHGSGPHLRVAAHDGHAGGERAVNAEHHELGSSRHHRQVAVGRGVVAPEQPGESTFILSPTAACLR